MVVMIMMMVVVVVIMVVEVLMAMCYLQLFLMTRSQGRPVVASLGHRRDGIAHVAARLIRSTSWLSVAGD